MVHMRRGGSNQNFYKVSRVHCYSLGCESSDFDLILDFFFVLHKTPFSDLEYTLKSTSFQAIQIISDFFSQMHSHPCTLVCPICIDAAPACTTYNFVSLLVAMETHPFFEANGLFKHLYIIFPRVIMGI